MVSVAVIAYTGGTLAAVAKAGAGIRAVPDFRGKRIASQKGSTTEYVFTHVIGPRFGFKPGDYQLVNVEFQDHVSALAAGSVDAFLGVEPYPSLAVVRGLGVEIVNYGTYDLAPLFLAANASAVARNTEGFVLFLKGWLAADAIFKKDPGKAAQLVTGIFRREGYDIPQAVSVRALRHMDINPYYLPGLRQYMDAHQPVARILRFTRRCSA
jgi:ABC-type nitrate/sulfonate/bicarbonate transport system substrate-binding protein